MPPPPTEPARITLVTTHQMNPYVQQLIEQGKEPSKAPDSKVSYPRTIGARIFQTEQDYKEALHDFLNGY